MPKIGASPALTVAGWLLMIFGWMAPLSPDGGVYIFSAAFLLFCLALAIRIGLICP